jgi:uncharacterized glyoxalase superfamily protein PhnB
MSPRPNIFPALRYEDAPAAIDWLVDAFGSRSRRCLPIPDGSIAHAQLQLGPAVVGLSSAHKIPGNPWSEVKQGIYVHVADVDTHHARAVAAGATIIMPLKDMEYGSREYGISDVDGHLVGFWHLRHGRAIGGSRRCFRKFTTRTALPRATFCAMRSGSG